MVNAFEAAAGRGIDNSGPAFNCTPRFTASAAIRFIGGSLKARATRSEAGVWKTSAVGPYCSSSPASSTAVQPPSSKASPGSVVA